MTPFGLHGAFYPWKGCGFRGLNIHFLVGLCYTL